MTSITRILHKTEYLYDQPVMLNPHRLMLRPRDGHDLWVDDAYLTISPRASLRWFFDTFGNSIAEATFDTPTKRLVIESELLLRRYTSDLSGERAGTHSCPFPFRYTDDEALDLAPFLALQNPGDEAPVRSWLAATFDASGADALTVLRSLSDCLHLNLHYSAREEMGTQSAAETLDLGVGTCRDFAFLFMEAARCLGFAARFVTGYLNDRPRGLGLQGGGSTHAWADVYVPDLGWIEFDPTNRITAGSDLIRVATTRTPEQASPISGSFQGNGAVCLGLHVGVDVGEAEAASPAGTDDPVVA
jgi:transglutaminase-like putative cysteine protease